MSDAATAAEIAQLMSQALQHQQSERPDAAAAIYEQVLMRQPDHVDALHLLGVVMARAGRGERALELIDRAIALSPRQAGFHLNLGNVLRQLDRADEAIDAYATAAGLRADSAALQWNLGAALEQAGRTDQAIAAFQAAVRADPNLPHPYVSLSDALRRAGRLADAADAARTALRLLNDDPHVRGNLANILLDQGLADEAIELHRGALAAAPQLHFAFSNLLLALHNRVQDPQSLYREHLRWAERYERPLPAKLTPHHDRDRNRRLRVGFVSGDFYDHPVGRLILPIIQRLNRAQFSSICFGNSRVGDEITAAIRAAAGEWHVVDQLDDTQLAQLIGEQRIDILIDLAGHSANNRLLAFALKPAPVQITYLGYPNTTGMRSIDFRITDAVADPPGGADALNTEKLVRLSRCFLSVRLAQDAIAPVDRDGHFTFGCFNKFAKVSPQTMEMWSRILRALPQARLVLKSRGLDDPRTQTIVREKLAAHGLPVERIELTGRVKSPSDARGTYNRIDVALDPFPYSGTATTIDALSMGVPVVTLAGTMHVSRVSGSLLTAAGLGEWIASDADAYVEKAVAAAAHGMRSIDLRRGLREQVAASVLCDEAGLVEQFQEALRFTWREHCR
jgi:predicted O-linked N-acetylglucosamine transferase (SPINDLY family)